MNTQIIKLIFIIVISAMASISVVGQKPVFEKCEVSDPTLKSVKYYIGRISRSHINPGLAVDIMVKSARIDKENLLLITKHLSQTFCRESDLTVGIFDDKKTADYFDLSLPYAKYHWRGEYILNSQTGEEYINFVTVPDYSANGHTLGIKIDLRDRQNLRTSR